MGWLKGMRARVRDNVRRERVEREMDDEFRFHLEMEAERLEGEGLSPEEARRQAMLAFGGVEGHKERMRDGRGLRWLAEIWRDVRVAGRGLRRSPALAVGGVASLGMAIGLATAVFSFGNAIFLKPLPVPAGDALVNVGVATDRSGDPGAVSYPDYVALRDHSRTLSGLAAHSLGSGIVRLENVAPAHMGVGLVSGDFFQVLGLRPALGRFFLPDEDRTPGESPVAVVSHTFWRIDMGGDPGAVGRRLFINRQPFTIVGVAPEGFDGAMPPLHFDVFIPLMMQGVVYAPPDLTPDGHWGRLLGRMRPDVAVSQVRAEIAGIWSGLARGNPGKDGGGRLAVEPVRGMVPHLKDSGGQMVLLLGAMALLCLLVACFNIAGLLLARAVTRRREIAIRLSLGAGRLALVRQLLIESLLIAIPGGMLGLVLFPVGTRAIQGFLVGPGADRTSMDLGADVRVLGFAILAAVACALFFGLVPALQATRPDLLRSLRGEAPAGRHQRRLSGWVVTAQVALSVVLLFGAGALLRGVLRAQLVDPGFDAERVVVGGVAPSGPTYQDPGRKAAFLSELVRRLEADPAVEAVGLGSTGLLYSYAPTVPVLLAGEAEPTEPGGGRQVPFNAVTAGTLEMLRVPLLRGRLFDATDREGAPRVAVTNESLARELWPGADPVGQTFRIGEDDIEVIGVVADAKYVWTAEKATPYLFLSYAQNRAQAGGASVYLRMRGGDPHAAVPLLARAVQSLDPDVPVLGTLPLADNLREALQPARSLGVLIGVGATLALVLAALGTYALLSHTVSRRTREIGVRIAVGAAPGSVRAMIVRQGVRLVVVGIVLGLPLGYLGARVLRSTFESIGPADPASAVGVAAVLLLVALLASWVPAWRATRVNPVDALRVE